tara:strand:+ start:6776 stop:8515 length:1740 start_codon:yes stop_codon:yes gene_type:complete
MATNYWSVDNVTQIGEEKVQIPSENGLSYTSGQKITLFVPPTVQMMDGKNSYLEFDIKLSAITAGGTPTLLQLDEAGAGVIFKNIRIYDGTRGNLIEELNEYSNLVCLRYDYDTDNSKRNLRALEEGGTTFSIPNRSTKGTSKSAYTDTIKNPYFPEGAGKDSALTDADFLTVKCCVPLHTGVFSGSIFPVAMSNGLYMEFDLQPAARVIKQLDTAVDSRRLKSNPFYGQILETGSGAMASDWVNGSATQELYLAADNNLSNVGDGNEVNRVPFVVGETVGLMKVADGTKATFSGALTITEINASSNGFVEVLFGNSRTNTTGENIVSGEWVLYSTAVCDATSYPAEYTVSNFNLVVHEVKLDPSYMAGMLQKAREGKAIEFDIHSVTNYKNSLLASDRQTSFLIHAQNSRAKSLVVQPCDSSIYTSAQLISASETYKVTEDAMDTKLNSNRSGLVGICDELSSVQYQINGKLVPSRPISTKKCATRESIDAFHLYELEKTLDNAGVVPRSFRKYLENWNLGRGFATQQGAMDLRDKDLSVLLKYEETTAPTKNKIINSFVFHVRRLVMRGSGAVEVIV